MDTISGIFSWTPAEGYSDTTNSIVVLVTDDGEPPLSASTTATIVVRPQPSLRAVLTSATSVALTWDAIATVKYRVLYTDSLAAPLWQPLAPDVTATGATATASDTGLSGVTERFYRVQVVEGRP